MKNKAEEFAKDDAEVASLIESGRMCPACYCLDIIKGHWPGDMYAPEADYKECEDCGHQWDIGQLIFRLQLTCQHDWKVISTKN